MLFYDLVIVVLVGQASHHFAGHLTRHGLGEFATVLMGAATFSLVEQAHDDRTPAHRRRLRLRGSRQARPH
ncbi:hypothetical protein [Streptomyces sp. NBC_00009]|uniref:hypothetical protein n=1 Tax=Streptomyces sp. NBC_00009 TaxID=2975620 RepID=UPI003250F967